MRLLGGVLALVILAVAPAAVAQTAPTLDLRGLDGARVVLDAATWEALPRHTVALTAHGKTHRYEGPLLADVLARAGAPLGTNLRGPALATYVVVRAVDGYVVVLSLAEVDPTLGGHDRILLADRDNGAALPEADGPLRLVVEGDTRPARSARQVRSVTLHRAE